MNRRVHLRAYLASCMQSVLQMSGPSFRDIPPGQKKRGAFALRFCPLFAFLQCPSRTPYCADGRLALRRRSTASRTRAACECNHHVLASGNCSCAEGRKQGHGNLTRLDPSRPLPMLLDRHLIKPFFHFLAAEGASVLSALQHGAGQRASKPGPWGSSPKKSKTKKQRVDEREIARFTMWRKRGGTKSRRAR